MVVHLKSLKRQIFRNGGSSLVKYIFKYWLCLKTMVCIKAEDVKDLPHIEEIHGLNAPPPPQVVEVNSLLKLDEKDIPFGKTPRQCYLEFDNYIGKQNYFNARVMKQLEHNAHAIDRLSDLLFRIVNDVKGVSKHASMVQTQLE